ncbi:MAG: cation diffusion facilitator family transporter [Promethearchaeota archaeon]
MKFKNKNKDLKKDQNLNDIAHEIETILNLLGSKKNKQYITPDNENNSLYGIKELFFTLMIYLSLFVLKLFIGHKTNSYTLISDAFHNLIDSFGFISVILGIKISTRKPDERYPFGLYKLESLMGMIISVLVFYTAIEFISENITRILQKEHITLIYNIWAIIIPLIGAILLIFSSLILSKTAQISKSPSLKAESINVKSDSYINLAILIVLIISFTAIPFLDIIFVFFIAFLIILSGFEILLSCLKDILDLGISLDIKEKIFEVLNDETIKTKILETIFELKEGSKNENIISSIPPKDLYNIESIKDIKGRTSGRFIFLEIKIQIDYRLKAQEIESLKRLLIMIIKFEYREIDKIMFEFVIKVPATVKLAIPLKIENINDLSNLDIAGKDVLNVSSVSTSGTKGLIKIKDLNEFLDLEIGTEFGSAKYYAILEINQDQIIEAFIFENPYKETKNKKGIMLVEKFAGYNINLLITRVALKKGPKYALESLRIKNIVVESERLGDIDFPEIFRSLSLK